MTPRVAQGPWDRLSHRTGTSFPVAGSVCWDWAVSLPLALQEGLQVKLPGKLPGHELPVKAGGQQAGVLALLSG